MPGLYERIFRSRHGVAAALFILASVGSPGQGFANTVIYNCQGGTPLNATFNNTAGTVTLEIGGNLRITLSSAVTGSGMRFTGGGYEAYGKAGWLNVVRPGQPELRCQQIGEIGTAATSPPPQPAPQYTPPQQYASPSFNCGGRLNATEARLCSNPTLADLDRKMASTYSWLRGQLRAGQRGQLKQDQRQWLGQRNSCGSNDQCIEGKLYERIAYLNEYLQPGQPQQNQPPPPQYASPSFNCGGRLNATEARLCSNPTLADLDRKMASTFKWLRDQLRTAQRGQLKQDQRQWLKQRNRCGSNDQCIERVLYERIAYLNEYL